MTDHADGHEARRVEHLISELDKHQEGRDENAQAELISIGSLMLPALLDRAATLSPGGQLCAIDVFRTLRAPDSETALIIFLSSEDKIVRAWAAEAIGHLGMARAIPELQELLVRSGRAGTLPDDQEPVSARHALTALGARQPVVPAALQQVMTHDPTLGLVVDDRLLTDALEALGSANQVVAYFQRWRPWKDTWTHFDSASCKLDWTAPWSTLVEESVRQAKAAAASRSPEESAVVGIEWLGIDDWPEV